MTPRQLQALRKRQVETFQREELLVGILAATTANYGFCRPEKPVEPESFMLHPLTPRAAAAAAPVTGDQLLAKFRALPEQFRKQTPCQSSSEPSPST